MLPVSWSHPLLGFWSRDLSLISFLSDYHNDWNWTCPFLYSPGQHFLLLIVWQYKHCQWVFLCVCDKVFCVSETLVALWLCFRGESSLSSQQCCEALSFKTAWLLLQRRFLMLLHLKLLFFLVQNKISGLKSMSQWSVLSSQIIFSSGALQLWWVCLGMMLLAEAE